MLSDAKVWTDLNNTRWFLQHESSIGAGTNYYQTNKEDASDYNIHIDELSEDR